MARSDDRQSKDTGASDDRARRRDNSQHGMGPMGDAAWPTRSEGDRGQIDTEPSGGQRAEDVGMPNPSAANPATIDYAAGVSKDVEDARRRKEHPKAARARDVGSPTTSDPSPGQLSSSARAPDIDLGHGRDRTYDAAGDALSDVGGLGDSGERAPTARETEGMGGADEDEDVAQGPSWEDEMRHPDNDAAPDDDRADRLFGKTAGGPPEISTTRSQGLAGGQDEAGMERSAGQMSRHYGAGGVTEEDLDEQEERRPGAHRGGPDTSTAR